MSQWAVTTTLLLLLMMMMIRAHGFLGENLAKFLGQFQEMSCLIEKLVEFYNSLA